MEVQVVSIEPAAQPGTYTVGVTIDDQLHEFVHRITIVPVGDAELQVITGPTALTELLHGQSAIDAAIGTLVGRRYAGRRVRLPAVVGRVTAPPIVRQLPSSIEVEQH